MPTIKSKVKIQIKAGKATPAPPIGPSLAPHGVNIPQFCKKFNDETKDREGVVPVEITVFDDKSYELKYRVAPASDLLKKIAGISKGSGTPHKKKVAKITEKQLEEVAIKKIPDLNANDTATAKKIIAGTARSMGIDIVERET